MMISHNHEQRPTGARGRLTENERAWVEFIRLASRDTDPKPTLKRVQQLQKMFRA